MLPSSEETECEKMGYVWRIGRLCQLCLFLGI